MKEVKWELKNINSEQIYKLAYDLQVDPIIAALYISRGLDTIDKFEKFINIDINNLHDYKLLPDIDKAVNSLIQAIENNKKILVLGDYDVDGIMGTTIMVKTLKKLNADIIWKIPHRLNDGYGLKISHIEQAAKQNVNLIITNDNGITAFEPALKAKELGIDLIITDHHQQQEKDKLPECIAVVNPNRYDSNYPFKSICGAVVALKVMEGLVKQYQPKLFNSFIDNMIEFAALATVADIMPLIDENRIIVAIGCKKLENSNKEGIRQLLQYIGIKRVTSTAINFFIAPRINAVGRLNDASLAVELMLETSKNKAYYLVQQLDKYNRERQNLQEEMLQEALELIEEQDKIILLHVKNWHSGIIGLLASKLTDLYYKPSIICSVDENTAKGSCRSIPEFNILEALKSVKNLFKNMGGHAYAAGFEISTDNLEKLKCSLNKLAEEQNLKTHKNINIDLEISPKCINTTFINNLMLLSPFGYCNPEPIFLTKGFKIHSINIIGENSQHLKFILIYDDYFFEAIYWRNAHRFEEFNINESVDIVYKVTLNEFNNKDTIVLIIEDIKKSNMQK